jgi:hypothetical protein
MVVSPPTAGSFHSAGPGVRADALASNGNGYHSVQANTSLAKQNRRRLFLIRKKFHSPGGLSTAEATELTDLQTAFEAHLDATRPLPMEMLEDLERLAEELEAAEPGA